jgi:hypothetical protein
MMKGNINGHHGKWKVPGAYRMGTIKVKGDESKNA